MKQDLMEDTLSNDQQQVHGSVNPLAGKAPEQRHHRPAALILQLINQHFPVGRDLIRM